MLALISFRGEHVVVVTDIYSMSPDILGQT